MATLKTARRIVIKIGSALLVDAQAGLLRSSWLSSLVEDVAGYRKLGIDVVLVSSGSIALGRQTLNLCAEDMALEHSQAAAAVGQIRLARAYEEALSEYDIEAAQVLVTLEDTHDRKRYLNMRTTLETLLSLGVVPIVNENDTIATDEIRYGDNDRLAAQVAVSIGADRLVLLSDVDGLYTKNPQLHRDAQHLPVIEKITPDILAMAGDSVSAVSKGGMKTKLMAAQISSDFGCDMCIMMGADLHPLKRLEEGARASWFIAHSEPSAARKRWIAALQPKGEVYVDDGAASALYAHKSLLPAGVVKVEGAFVRGDLVQILNAGGQCIAVGLAHYHAQDALKIIGCKSEDITDILGYKGRSALVHRDDLVTF